MGLAALAPDEPTRIGVLRPARDRLGDKPSRDHTRAKTAAYGWARLDSNQGPCGYEPLALTAELRARGRDGTRGAPAPLRSRWFRAAKVDGRPVSIVAYLHDFQAVAVPAGSHEVEWSYRPRAWLACVVASLLGLALCAAAFVPRRRGDGVAAR